MRTTRLRTIIIDDEEDAIDALQLMLTNYCDHQVDIIGSSKNSQEGLQLIHAHQPDLVFLDIQMPVLSGLDILKQISHTGISVIFCTSYNQYAIKAVRFSALDYLLKPVDIEELQEAVQKAMFKSNPVNITGNMDALINNVKFQRQQLSRLTIPTMEGLLFIEVNDILYCLADNNYTEVCLKSGEKIIISRTLKDVEEMLEGYSFLRIHQSHLINLKCITRYIKGDGGYVIMSDGRSLEVSRRRKESFLKVFSAF